MQDASCQALACDVTALAADGDLSLADLVDAAASLQHSGATAAADDLYRTWLAHAGRHPLAYVARFNFAASLASRGRLRQAKDLLLAALDQKPDFLPAFINLGSVLERLDDRIGAVAAFQRVSTHLPQLHADSLGYKATALNQMARILENAKIEAPAEAAMRDSLAIDPCQREVIQHYVALRQTQCTWPVLQDLPRLRGRAQMQAMSPLSLAAQIDDPVLQLAHAATYNLHDAKAAGIATAGQWPPPTEPRSRRLRIGYVSSDLREHAIGYLISRLFTLHDRTRVDIFAYYCGPAQQDAMQAHFSASVDYWRNISDLPDRKAASLIVQDGIDILVDINGYTKDGRLTLFALRPAPIIVNWLGYPGTLGSPHHHYILADNTIIPPQDDIYYAESVLRLPCYQPNDPHRSVSAEQLSRADAGLPEAAFVFCVFNGTHKITPAVFGTWMRILADAPRSVLWLLCDSAETRDRLREHASARGVDPARLIFAGRMANAQHLARYRLADLFLDTAPYGAHTTASDALWMGVPVLTCAGNGFAARVCASLVAAAGIPDMVCGDWDEYHAVAVRLAQSPSALAAIKTRLEASREHCALFDTPLLVRSLEDCYDRMWREYCEGTLPCPRLDHAALYHRIGCDPARPALPARAALQAWYAMQLEYEAPALSAHYGAALRPLHRTKPPPHQAEPPAASKLAA